MTDAPLSPPDVEPSDADVGDVARLVAEWCQYGIAAAARVPELLHKIELLRADCGTYERQRDAARTENVDLRARLDAAPDLTELRTANENARNAGYGHVASRHLGRVVDRLLAAVPSTGADGGAA